MPISTIEELREHVALATKVELATVPPYLYAMYSIKDQQSTAARLIASVVVEEMLHVCLTTNLLLALGGEPTFGREAPPEYPGWVPHRKPELRLHLRGCSEAHVRDTFLEIERPREVDDEPQDDDFATLGQFYSALERALIQVGATTDLFAHHQPHRQLARHSYYDPVEGDAEDSGGLMLVCDAASAQAALDIVIHQGEGVGHERWADASHSESTHYYKFSQLLSGEVEIGPVWPVLDNPRTHQFPHDVRPVSDLFNAFYRLSITTLADLFSGSGDQDRSVSRLYSLMTQCMAPTARYLVTLPVADGRHAGPTFEDLDLGPDPDTRVRTLAVAVAADHPALEAVARHVLTWA